MSGRLFGRAAAILPSHCIVKHSNHDQAPRFRRRIRCPLAFFWGSLVLAAALLLASSTDARADQQVSADPAPAPKSMKDLAAEAFASHCAACHAYFGTEGFIRLTPTEIYSVLRHGQMQEPATGLDDGTIHALAETLGNPKAAQNRPPHGGAKLCSGTSSTDDSKESWPEFSNNGTNTRVVDRHLTAKEFLRTKLRWAFVIPEAAEEFWLGAGNPVAVAHGRVYFANINRWVYALDAQTGCAYWTFRADAPVRAGAAVEGGIVTFGDARSNVYALDEVTGQLRWRDRADEQSFARITGSLIADRDRVYVGVSSLQETLPAIPERSCCTSNGNVSSYDIRTGGRVWQTYLIDQPLQFLGTTGNVHRFGPSGVSLLAPPSLDTARNVVYVATGNQTTGPFVPESDAVIALDMNTGKKKWVRTLAPTEFGGQDIFNYGCIADVDPARERCPPENPGPGERGDREFAAPVMVVRRGDGRDILIAGSKAGVVYALDPDEQGKILWQTRVAKGGDIGGIMAGMAADDKVAYVPVTDIGFLNSASDGALNAVDLATGKLLWRTPVPRDGCVNKGKSSWNGIWTPPVLIGDVVVTGSMDGVLRAYEKKTGRQFWSFDAVQEFAGVNGYAGKGGGFGTGGVAIVGNRMYIASGAGFGSAGLKGNVLLAFDLGESSRH